MAHTYALNSKMRYNYGNYRSNNLFDAVHWQRGCRAFIRSSTGKLGAAQEQVVSSDAELLSNPPQRFIGSIRVCNIEGKGRGVVATQAIKPGQLLLCCRPLGVVTGPQQASLSVSDLQVHLASSYSAHTHAWLGQLYDGTEGSTQQLMDLSQSMQQQKLQQQSSSSSSNGHHSDHHEHNHHHQQHHHHQQQQQQPGLSSTSTFSSRSVSHYGSSNGSGSGSSSGSCCSSMTPEVPPVTDAVLQRLMDVVRFNAYGDQHDDLAAAALTGQQPVALLGLWPEFSMLNHSCLPNAINWVLPGVDRAMVVRAARHIAAGEEVTISYLGAPQLLPLDGRREALEAAFGFQCGCPRCRAEEDIPQGLEQLLQDTVSRVSQSFAPRLRRAAANSDKQQLQEVRRQAAAMMTLLYQQLRSRRVQPLLRHQLLASCYPCLEVIADADTALADQQAAAASLAKCLSAVAAVTPGSDLHVILASKLAGLQQELHGEGSAEAAAAWVACVDAHNARYGAVGEGRVRQLAEYNRTLYV